MVQQGEQVRFALAARTLQDQGARRARTVKGPEGGLTVAGRIRDGENLLGSALIEPRAVRFDEGNGRGGQMARARKFRTISVPRSALEYSARKVRGLGRGQGSSKVRPVEGRSCSAALKSEDRRPKSEFLNRR